MKEMLEDYRRLKNKLPQALLNATERLVNEAVEEISSDDAHYSIEKLPTTNSSGKIEGGYRTTNPIDLFKEFGTGYIGSQNPSTSPFLKEAGWEYDASNHGEKGWVYPKDGKFYHTYGEIGKNVFTDATLKMEDKVQTVILEEINKILEGGN